MPSDRTVAEHAIQQAINELRRGRRQSARSWALKALSLAPEWEEPWLIMGELASPAGSPRYYEEALKIDPESPRARRGLDKALRRADNKNHFLPTRSPQAKKETAQPEPKKRRQKSLLKYKRRWGLILIAPWLIGLLVFKLAPILATLGFSFTDAYLLSLNETKFYGLRNYISLLTDPAVGAAFLGTIRLAGIVIPLQVIAAILLATILNDGRLRRKNTLRILFYLPSIIPSMASLFMWEGFVDPNSGWLNRLILNPLGLPQYAHLQTYGATDPSLSILATLWSIGPGFMIILGAMQGLPTDVFEAAVVDGATRLRRFFSITLPLVSPAIFFTLILNLTAIFGGTVLLDRGDTYSVSRSSVDALLYYLQFDTYHLGAASSLAWIFFIFMLAIVIVLFVTSKYWVFFPDREN